MLDPPQGSTMGLFPMIITLSPLKTAGDLLDYELKGPIKLVEVHANLPKT